LKRARIKGRLRLGDDDGGDGGPWQRNESVVAERLDGKKCRRRMTKTSWRLAAWACYVLAVDRREPDGDDDEGRGGGWRTSCKESKEDEEAGIPRRP
jgi:hypothetical protein